MDIVYTLDLIGTFVFAISGALAASEKKFDIFGAGILALLTAVGGGTLRDVLIGSTPVAWMKDLNYLLLIAIAVPVSYFFKKLILKLRRTMFLFDTIGIGLFTILGLQKTLSLGLSPIIAVMMGAVSAVFGGVLRDVFSNEVPLIFRKEIYATACLFGGALFILLQALTDWQVFNMIFSILIIVSIRYYGCIEEVVPSCFEIRLKSKTSYIHGSYLLV